MKPANLLILILAAVLTISSCKESLTNPEPTPGRRDYVWKVDTVIAFKTAFNGIWGATPDDIWAVNFIGDSDTGLWHYNGKTWSVYQKEYLLRAPNAIWGNSRDKIWAVCDEGHIYRYHGNAWKLDYIYEQNDGFATCMDIWGRNSSDIYVCGVINLASKKEQRAFILHYDGIKWKEYFKADYISQFNSILGDDKNVLVTGTRILFETNNHIKHDSLYIAKVANNKTSVLFSQSYDLAINQHLGIIGNKLHTIINNQLYICENSTLKPIFEIKYPKFIGRFYGRNYKDIFLGMLDGVGHYNGNDIQYLYRFNSDFHWYRGRPLDFGNIIFFNSARDKFLQGKLIEK